MKQNETQKNASELIFKLESGSNSHWQKKDIQWITENVITPDTVQYSPGFPPMNGEGYAKWMQEFADEEGINFSFEPKEVVVSESGEMAYCLGVTKLEEAGKPDRIGKFVSVYRKLDIGWRCLVEANNFNDA